MHGLRIFDDIGVIYLFPLRVIEVDIRIAGDIGSGIADIYLKPCVADALHRRDRAADLYPGLVYLRGGDNVILCHAPYRSTPHAHPFAGFLLHIQTHGITASPNVKYLHLIVQNLQADGDRVHFSKPADVSLRRDIGSAQFFYHIPGSLYGNADSVRALQHFIELIPFFQQLRVEQSHLYI